MAEPEKSLDDIERELALRAHERDWALQDAMFRTVIDYGLAALRASTLISGGSVVVGLAFAGSIYSSGPDVAKRLLLAVLIFAVGAVLGAVATGFCYLAQYRFTEAGGFKTHRWEYPYVVDVEPHASTFRRKGTFWLILAIATVVASYMLVIGGIVTSWWALPPS